MNRFKIGRRFSATLLLAVSTVIAGDTATKCMPVIAGYASFEAGEIMKGYSSVPNISEHELWRTWLQTGYVGLRLEAAVNGHLRVLVGGEAQTHISFLRTEGNMNDAFTESRQPRTLFSIRHGEGIFTIGNSARALLQVEAGFFPYKYNQEVRNLGEYLFRTYCYPASMVNEFDKPYADLTGIRIGGSVAAGPGTMNADFLLTTSTRFWPFMNWSPALLVDYSIPRIFTIGAGVQFWNLIPVGVNNPRIGSWVGGSPTEPDSNSTFAGTKLMTRFSFDGKGLFPADAPFVAMLGKDDLKLYGETAVLGWKNYPGPDSTIDDGYEQRLWRVPFMFGINLPVFTVLDLLSIELEYRESPYPNSIFYPVYRMEPKPADRQDHAQWKWSVYAGKNLGPHVGLVFQAARDHIMPQSTIQAVDYSDCTDVLLRKTDWWWTGKVRFSF
ncbi:MAG: hypothetical protein JXA18_15120 [Chitinispirillaceae bacterium]|nr:hypothetical protein [Chitinispirillaceae bacterium]